MNNSAPDQNATDTQGVVTVALSTLEYAPQRFWASAAFVQKPFSLDGSKPRVRPLQGKKP